MNLDEDIIIQKNVDGEDTYLFDPYNPLNKLITNEEIEDILKKYGLNVTIHNYNLYKRAFVHRSYTKRPDIENKQNNNHISR